VSGVETRERLQRAALAAIREDGIAGLSARSIASRADINQALIFYHYGGVFDLLEKAAQASVEDAVERYRQQFDAAESFGQLLTAGRQLHDQERAAGNVAVMAQLTAAAHLDAGLAAAARRCLGRWVDALEPTVRRLLRDSPLDGLVDHRGLARAVSAGFIGLELYDGVDRPAADAALASLEQLGVVLEAVDGLGAVARRAIRAQIRRRTRTR
jgi:AcrR family transcriptional regulator